MVELAVPVSLRAHNRATSGAVVAVADGLLLY